MSDEDGGKDAPLPFGRAYDFFKHMTGITLISIGGVFALMDNSAAKLNTKSVVAVLAALGCRGLSAC